MNLYNKVWELIGPVGGILVLLAIISLYTCLRNGIYLRLVERDFHRNFDNLEQKDTNYFKQFHHNSDNPLINIIAEVVMVHAKHSEDMRAEVSYMFHRNFSSVFSAIAYLRLISVVSPLLGLMGTMLGMVDIFQVVATSSNVDTTFFAQGIWEALTTTILGLAVAIPTLFFYYHLMLKMKGFRIEAVEHSYRATELFLGTNCPSNLKTKTPLLPSAMVNAHE